MRGLQIQKGAKENGSGLKKNGREMLQNERVPFLFVP